MNLLKIFPSLLDGNVEKIHLVASKSQPGLYYQVREDKHGNMQCECIAFAMSEEPKICKHIQIINYQKYGTKLPGL